MACGAFRVPTSQSNEGGCFPAGDCRPAVVARDGSGEVQFHGIIDEKSVSAFDNIVKAGDTLHIESDGGFRQAAIRMGFLIVRKHIKVTVDSGCYSACALYVFLTARKKTLYEPAFLLFHNPASVWVKLSRRHPEWFTQEELREIESGDKMERELYNDAGIDPEFLDCISKVEAVDLDRPVSMTLPVGVSGDVRDHIGTETGVGVGKYRWVAFSKTTLQHYGVKDIGEYWYPVENKWRNVKVDNGNIAWVDGVNGNWCG
jgi:hypothetical protein